MKNWGLPHILYNHSDCGITKRMSERLLFNQRRRDRNVFFLFFPWVSSRSRWQTPRRESSTCDLFAISPSGITKTAGNKTQPSRFMVWIGARRIIAAFLQLHKTSEMKSLTGIKHALSYEGGWIGGQTFFLCLTIPQRAVSDAASLLLILSAYRESCKASQRSSGLCVTSLRLDFSYPSPPRTHSEKEYCAFLFFIFGSLLIFFDSCETCKWECTHNNIRGTHCIHFAKWDFTHYPPPTDLTPFLWQARRIIIGYPQQKQHFP